MSVCPVADLERPQVPRPNYFPDFPPAKPFGDSIRVTL